MVGSFLKFLALSVMVLVVLIPMWSVLVTSLASRETLAEAGGSMVFLPKEIDFTAYQTILSGGIVTRALWISTLVTVAGTAISLTFTVLAAYGLSRPGSVGHRPILFYFLLTFLIYPGLVPTYLVVTGVGLKDSLWSLILPTAISVFNLVVMRGFFQNIPQDLLDSARIDGAGEFRILLRIVMPLSKAVIAVVGLFYAVGYWNAWFNALLFIDNSDKFPLQIVLRSMILLGQSPQFSGATTGSLPPTESIKMAVVVLTILPILVIYPFVQRHFIKGVILGAIKG
ncbi:ABC transporter permease [Phytohabitans aurantiacus]|uniref:ABC transporter permease n=1 Tax=Phytohabitans aurantiacus TaxID=3016789 RepID=A0ABQ5QQF0_9ACTN|nr:ABC transporter permease [Phytohabitans aurantiacus]